MYLLAERLVDSKTANIASGKIIRSVDLVRDHWMYESGNVKRRAFRVDDFPVECLQDVIIAAFDRLDELPLERADLNMSVRTLCLRDKCRYHLHGRQHPQCGVNEKRDGM